MCFGLALPARVVQKIVQTDAAMGISILFPRIHMCYMNHHLVNSRTPFSSPSFSCSLMATRIKCFKLESQIINNH